MRKREKRISLFFLCMTMLSGILLTACARGAEPAGRAGNTAFPVLIAVVLTAAVTAFLMNRRAKRDERSLEDPVTLPQQSLDRESPERQTDPAIAALSSEYRSVFRVTLDDDMLYCCRAGETEGLRAGDSRPFRQWITEYAERYVAEEERPAFLRFADPENLRAGLEKEPYLGHRYLSLRDGAERYEQLRFASEKAGDPAIGMAFSDVDAETREILAQKRTLSAALAEAEKTGKADLAFLSRMSHDIRTPMNAIIGLDTLALNDDTLSEKTRDYLMKIGDSAQHLLGLINEILDMSRIESGQMTLRKEEFHFTAMLEQLNSAFSAKCLDKGLTYECRFLSPVDDYYCGDEKRIREILSRLLENAVKYTDVPGSVTLSVARSTVFNDQTTLLFRIKDTGVGMDKEMLATLFEPFSESSGGRNTGTGGSGLGLSISKNLVELMDGSISVESEKGAGTEFAVTLTLKNCTQRAAAEPEELIDLHDMYVLVVDDNLNSAKYTKSVLDRVGIQADLCTSGPDALRMIDLQHGKHQPYHLVLMDCNMPDMDGLEATERIKAKYGSEITVVILTAYNWDYIAEDAKRVGVDSFLVKPLFPANVIEEFEQIARRNQIIKTREKGKAELAGRRILLAEDVEINAEILMDILEMENIEADHAPNGRIALEMFQDSPVGKYSAILMDVRMPVMDGLEATKAIRALEREDAGTIPIIALTANALDEDIKYSMQAGMNAHLNKPVEPERLFQVMGELVFERETATV